MKCFWLLDTDIRVRFSLVSLLEISISVLQEQLPKHFFEDSYAYLVCEFGLESNHNFSSLNLLLTATQCEQSE